MSKKEEQEGKDLMAINIEALVSKATDNQVLDEIPEESGFQEVSSEPLSTERTLPEVSVSWSNFNLHLKQMKSSRHHARKKAVNIDDNIIDVIESCNLGRVSITNVINAALRSFIDEHKQQLKGLLKPSPKLIIEE